MNLNPQTDRLFHIPGGSGPERKVFVRTGPRGSAKPLRVFVGLDLTFMEEVTVESVVRNADESQSVATVWGTLNVPTASSTRSATWTETLESNQVAPATWRVVSMSHFNAIDLQPSPYVMEISSGRWMPSRSPGQSAQVSFVPGSIYVQLVRRTRAESEPDLISMIEKDTGARNLAVCSLFIQSGDVVNPTKDTALGTSIIELADNGSAQVLVRRSFGGGSQLIHAPSFASWNARVVEGTVLEIDLSSSDVRLASEKVGAIFLQENSSPVARATIAQFEL